MSFSLRLSPDLLAVEAGATTPLAVSVSSRAGATEQFEMFIEGLDQEWVAMPEPMFNVDPGEDHIERIFFKPARVSESFAGNYPFVVKARSLATGESKSAGGVLQIKAYNHLAIEVGPKKGYYSKYRKQNVFSVTVVNLGNTEHTLQLFGSDPDDECAFDFTQESFVLAPGQSRQLEVAVTPKTERVLAGSRLFGFAITARSTNSPGVAASAQAQLEQRPMVSPGSLIAGVLFILIFLAWLALLPKPPQVTLTVNPTAQVIQGEVVHIAWESNTRVQIKVNGQIWQDQAPSNPAGVDFKVTTPGQLRVEAIPYKDDRLDPAHAKSHAVSVQPPPVVPDPEIDKFDAQDRSINLGESVILRYQVNDAVTSAKLAPTQQDLDIHANEIQVTPGHLGVNEYTLLAYNQAGKVAQKKLTINVHEKVDVVIDSFTVAPPSPLNAGEAVTLTWHVSKAATVQLNINGVLQAVTAEGSKSFPVTGPTTVVLLATDDKGHTVRKVQTIKVNAPTEPTPATTPPPDTAGGAGTTTGGG